MILKNKIFAIFLGFVLIATACTHPPTSTTAPTEDPLKNTKKLVAQGHVSLYKNGAFQIPTTEIKLIPAAPSAMGFALELAGFRARESLFLALKKARRAVLVIADDTKSTFRFAGKIRGEGHEVARAVTQWTRPHGKLLIEKSLADGIGIAGVAYSWIKPTTKVIHQTGADIITGTNASADHDSSETTVELLYSSLKFSKRMSSSGAASSMARFATARDEIIKGYAVKVPEKFRKYKSDIDDSPTLISFQTQFENSNSWRKKTSDHFRILVGETGKNYFSEVKKSLNNANEELKVNDKGLSFAAISGARWVLQAIFWDAIILPIGKITYGGLGYLTTNGLAFPVMLVTKESITSLQLAVEVTFDTSKMVYSFVAPIGASALAGLLGVAEFSGSQTGAAAVALGGSVAAGGHYLVTKSSSLVVRGGGFLAGKSVEHVGIPLAVAGIAVGGTAAGVVYSTSEATAGTGLLMTGEITRIGTIGGSNAGAGVVAIGGTTLSAVKGAAVGVYEISRAIIVPTGYELGAGVVLGYSTLSQLSAQTVLAASDFSYMVLSLEGPRWVLYAIKGKLNDGSAIAPGTVLNLQKLKASGEEISEIPASEGEMKKVLNTVEQDLPEQK